jgi:hypothetical protein
MHKRFILLAGILLISHGPAAAQISAPRIIFAQEHVAPIMTMLPTVSTPLPASSLLLPQNSGRSTAHFNFLLARAYERGYSLEHLSQLDEVKTLILTQSSLPLVELLAGRLQLNAFQSTLHLQNVQLGSFGNGGMQGSNLARQNYGGPGSLHLSLSGLSLSFQFGRDARREHSAQLWRRLTGIVGAVLN